MNKYNVTVSLSGRRMERQYWGLNKAAVAEEVGQEFDLRHWILESVEEAEEDITDEADIR